MLEINSINLLLWLKAFLFTQLIEVPIYMLALRNHETKSQRLLIAFGASMITHPIVWFGMPWHHVDYQLMTFIAEAFAIGIETLYLSWAKCKHPFLWAFGANLSSVAIGLTSRHFFGWP